MKFYIYTYGCAMNYSDSERIARLLTSLGYQQTDDEHSSDLYILTTCSVRQRGEDKVIGRVRQLHKERQEDPSRSHIRIALTGCMLHYGERALRRKMPGLDIVFDIKKLLEFPQWLGETYSESDELQSYFDIRPEIHSDFQVGIPIMTGCDNFCTYCIVPYSRGKEISRPMEDILAEVEDYLKKWYKEITLLGQNVNSYMKDPEAFARLVKEVDAFSDRYKFRLRYTSPHPKDFSDTLIGYYGVLPSVCECIHMPLQAGDNTVLKRMNRNYTTAEYRALIDKIRKHCPDIHFTTDMIVGFCGETEQQFQNTLDVFQQIGFDFSYNAQYSTRPGTVAARCLADDVPNAQKKDRWHRMNDLLKKHLEAQLPKEIGKTYEVLVEKYDPDTGLCSGRTRNFMEVIFPGELGDEGQFLDVKISLNNSFQLFGDKI